jgi:hypothetical protein
MAWPASWDRGSVLGAIEEASGQPLSADDPTPDMLIAKAQELGLNPVDLKLWIYDSPEHGWTPDALSSWAGRWLKRCGHCDAAVAGDLAGHACRNQGKQP